MTPTRRTLLGGFAAAALGRPALAKTDTIPVLMDHDGGMPDDYLALALLLTMPHVRLLGVAVTPADSYLEPAVLGTRKILSFFSSDAPIAESPSRGVHAFPAAWRKTSGEMDRLLTGAAFAIEKTAKPVAEPAGRFLADKLRASPEPVTIVATGPLSNIAAALDAGPDVESKIQELVWMGGAIQVRGNVEEDSHDGSAEWNAYWDPPAVGRVWKSKVPITLCPLDITNRVPVTKAFLAKLAKRGDFGELAAKAYTISMGQNSDLYFWDVLAASWVGKPDMFATRNFDTAVDIDGKSAGRIRSVDEGRKVKVLQRVDPEDFHKYLLSQWKR
ncbi:MAG: nucleoside hydrolase [Bryobacteraceae bacterium]